MGQDRFDHRQSGGAIMNTETAMEKALWWLNQACMDDEAVNQNPDIGRAIQALQSVLPRFAEVK